MNRLFVTLALSTLSATAFADPAQCEKEARAKFHAAHKLAKGVTQKIKEAATALDEDLKACGVKVDGVHEKKRTLVEGENLAIQPVDAAPAPDVKPEHENFEICQQAAIDVYQKTKASLAAASNPNAVQDAHKVYTERLAKCHAEHGVKPQPVPTPTIQPVQTADKKDKLLSIQPIKSNAALGASDVPPAVSPDQPGRAADPLTWWRSRSNEGLGPDPRGCGAQIGEFCKQQTKAAAAPQKKQAFVNCVVEHELHLSPKCRWHMTRKAWKWINEGRAEMPEASTTAAQQSN